MEVIIGIILLIAAVFLIVSVLMQNGKAHNVGAIQGGAETFFGKTKGSTIDKMLSKVTSIVAVVFCLLVVALYVFQEDTDYSAILDAVDTDGSVETIDTEADDTSAEIVEDGADVAE